MRIGFWDLETTALDADFGQLLCGVIGEYVSTDPLTPMVHPFELDDFKSPEGRCDDRGLATRIRDYIESFDLLVGYNSILFDKRFLNTRLAAYGERGCRFPRHKDLLYVMRSAFRLNSNSLANASIFLFGRTLKTAMDKRRWRQAHAGLRAAYNEVIEHCVYDVLEVARMWDRVKDVSGILK